MTDVTNLLLTLTCAGAPEAFRVKSISGGEHLGGLYEYHVELASKLPEVDMKAVLGDTMTVHLALDSGFRHFSGVVSRISRGEREFDETIYYATICPEQALLHLSHNCRIFQDVSVVDVVKTIFTEHKLRAPRESLFDTYRKWDYLTQYHESDYEFLRRILALEGIYFYFDHLPDGHQMVLVDSTSSHEPTPGSETVPIKKWSQSEVSDYLSSWHEAYEMTTNQVALRDIDFRLGGPALILKGRKRAETEHKNKKLRRYEYPGIFSLHENKLAPDPEATRMEGERLAGVRLEEKQGSFEGYEGEGTARGLRVGALFSISQVPALAGRKFMIVSTQVAFRNPAVFTSEFNDSGANNHVWLTAIDSKTQYRMPRLPKPMVHGPQTARVVGGKDAEIWTDDYGRVKLKFHWDRSPNANENSSCWVRVAHPWAGAKWGAVYIPRVGHEVVVQFLDGDPDRPLIIGSVYNKDNMPPYTLPDHKTQSGIKSRSTKKGTEQNFNEIRFEDEKGKEELHIQAELDMSTNVKRNQALYVGGDQSITIHGNQTISVHGTDEKTGKKLPVQSVTKVTGKHTFDASDTIKIQAPTSITLECGGSTIVMEPGKITMTAGGGATVVLDANALTQAKGGGNILVDANVKAEAAGGGQMLLDAKVTAQSAGGSKVQLDTNAAMEGAVNASVKGAVEATLAGAAGNVKADPAGVAISGPKVDVSGQALVSVAGAMVKIN